MNQTVSHHSGAGNVKSKSYVTGFVLSTVLTMISFALAMYESLPYSAALLCIFAAAVVQILVQLHYFLHLDASSEMQWNVLALVFTALTMLLFVGGSIWIMYNLHAKMM